MKLELSPELKAAVKALTPIPEAPPNALHELRVESARLIVDFMARLEKTEFCSRGGQVVTVEYA